MILFKRFFPGFIFLSAFFLLNSCKELTSLPAASVAVSGVRSLEAPLELKATNGGRRKISLSWNAVSVASFYRIYCSDSPNGTFRQVGESVGASYDDSVASGRTYYYRVSAVNGRGNESSLSEIVKGTSLATPIINSITEEDTYATVEWYAENAESYEDISRFEVHCTDGSQEFTAVVDGSEDSHTFYNLSANTTYQFYVELYTIKDPAQTEKSATVTKSTYALYTPVAPEFSASQGSSTDGVTLNITLPSLVQVSIEKDGGTLDVLDGPLYFEIYRKRASENTYPATPLVKKLYFDGDGTTEGTRDYSAYRAGDITSYTDKSVTRGIKYEYLIKSYIDTECPELKAANYNKILGSKTGRSAPGWAAAIPTFEIVNYRRVKSNNGTPDNGEDDFISSVSVQYSAAWDDMGKASVYRYAVKEKYTHTDDTITTAWVSDAGGNRLFSSLEAVNSITRTFDLTENASEKVGVYDYTLYIIPQTISVQDDEGNYVEEAVIEPTENIILTYKSASSSVTVSDKVNMPSTTFTGWKGGWTDRTQLTWFVEDDVHYSLKRGKDGEDKAHWKTIDWDTIKESISEDGLYEDTDVEGGHEYTYELYADNSHNDGIAVTVRTLGKPHPVFNTYAYDSISITWKDTDVKCAEYYEVTLGNSGRVGGGASAKFIVTGTDTVEIEGSTFDAGTTASIEAGEISLKITNPANYDDATISGLPADITVRAYSDINPAGSDNRTDAGTVAVNTMGPAAIKTSASVAQSDTVITVTWNKVPGAAAYLVRRDRMDSSNRSAVLTDSYIVPEAGGSLVDGYVSAEVEVNDNGENLILTDTTKAESGIEAWDSNQERLAWGYPYRYTVFPLLSAAESCDVSDSYTVVSDDIAYRNETALSATGSTNGYGLDVLATKSQDPYRVKITWTPPYSTEGNEPQLWRSSDAVNWTKLNAVAAGGSFIIKPAGDERTSAFYYAVSYAADDRSTAPHAVYTEEISSAKDMTYSPLEAKNYGYAFALRTQAANVYDSNGVAGFSEKFNYDLWNYDVRRVGPKEDAEYTISVKNNNFGPGYNAVAKVDKLKLITVSDISGYELLAPGISGTGKASQSITLTPANVVTNDRVYNTGLLSVLRDYKHYYKLGVTRTLGETETAFINEDEEVGGTIEASWCDEGSPTYAYRNITNAELAKAAMLVMTYGFFRVATGLPDYSNMSGCYVKRGDKDVAGGEFYNDGGKLSGGISGKYYHHFRITKLEGQGYAPAMLTPGGTQENTLSLSTTSQSITFWRKGLDEGFHCFEDQPVLEVAAANSEVGNIYDAKVTVKCGGEKHTFLGVGSIDSGEEDLKLTVERTYSGTSLVITANTKAGRREYFPIQFGKNREWDFKNATYGWWGPKQ